MKAITDVANYVDNTDFAMIAKGDEVTLYKGKNIVFENNTLEELEQYQSEVNKKIIFLLPFCTARREGVGKALGDESILAMEVQEEITISKQEFLDILPDMDIKLGDIIPNISDRDFEQKVLDIKSEINTGEVCQTVISREFQTVIQDYSPNMLLAVYKKLLQVEGGYMTYMYQRGDDVFAAASPEVHLSVDENEVVKSPIAGTMPKLEREDFLERLEEFLQNPKEINELAMVVDEELKMMMKISDGGKISPLQLREIAAVIHTEYILKGKPKSGMSVIDMLRHTLFSPTLVGGPLESAYKQIVQHEGESRAYYGTTFGVYDGHTLDSCIPIRAAHIHRQTGEVSVRAGAGIVSGSDPQGEVDETIKKSNGFFSAITSDNILENYLNTLTQEEENKLDKIMKQRDDKLSKFYMREHDEDLVVPKIQGKNITIISNGDDFSYMIEYMLQAMGAHTTVIENIGDSMDTRFSDLVVLGPGYGDVNNEDDLKMIQLGKLTEKLHIDNKNIFGICLGHQAIVKHNSMNVVQKNTPTQGEQLETKYGNMGFYNSFSAQGGLDVFRNIKSTQTGSIQHKTISTQFHPESIMSTDGFEVLKKMVLEVI